MKLYPALLLAAFLPLAGAAPRVAQVSPPPGAVTELRAVAVTFDAPVQGVNAEDLLVNNQPALAVSGSGAAWRFEFPQPGYGPVDLTWESGHFIADLSGQPFDAEAPGAAWSYRLLDVVPPVASVNPPPGATVRRLSQVEVRFTEPVTGLGASDLLLNGSPATNLLARPGNLYVFEFPEQTPGSVTAGWAPAHGIADLAAPANPFAGKTWTYLVDRGLSLEPVLIAELLAAQESATALKDEDAEPQDWLELFNPGVRPVNLAGWSLTDDPGEPDLWVFPGVTLAPGARLVVFASGKDRKSNPARLHTNFRLSGTGEYLALFNAEAPRIPIAGFTNDYPEQRNDYSYGIDDSGAWRYFQRPTPGLPNGGSTILGVLPPPGVSQPRGYRDSPFPLELSNAVAGATIRWTTNGSAPGAGNGAIYSGPIVIDRTTVFRAAAFAPGYLPSLPVTHSYIFLDQVARQSNNPAGFPSGPAVMSGYPSDYEMDPEIVNAPEYRSLIRPALEALPVLSIVLRTDDMFGAANGIYTHPLSRGPAWERPCSVEFIPLDGKGFQVDAGIQIQGNAAREPVKQPKHPFRLTFKGEYGPSKLHYRMFPDSPVDVFDTLILRADFNSSWLHWDPAQRTRAQRTRDAWMKDSMRAMGGLAGHNRFVHLYLNGLYWGIYEPAERPDGSFGAAYLGGEKEDYDVINEGAVVDGTSAAYRTLLDFSNLAAPAQYSAIQRWLDLPQFIDYMLLHFYVGHQDWGNNKNWYALRPRDGSGGFKYVPWDGELILAGTTVNRVGNPDVPSGLHTKLLANPEYQLAFADRVHKHFFNGGALTPARLAERWMDRARPMELPIVAESARWGDYRRDVHPYQSPPYELYTRDRQWRAEQARLLTGYFPTRTGIVLGQLRAAGLYPAVAAPVFSRHGGRLVPGFKLAISAPAGTIYYTTDGSDPRGMARVYSGPFPVAEGVIKARAFSGTWSALTEAAFTPNPFLPAIRIAEIMYNPDPPGDAFEFIELQNCAGSAVDIGGWYLTGVDYLFPPRTMLAPGQIVLLASAAHRAGFGARYPGVKVFGGFGGQLANRGERLALVTAAGQTVQSVDYRDAGGWPESADGAGYSLELADPFADPDDPANWHASAAPGGSPGQPNSIPPAPAVVIAALGAAGPGPDFLTLSNRTSAAIGLTGWTLREAGGADRFVFTAGSLPPRQTIAVTAPFPLDRDGETVLVLDPSGTRTDAFTFGPQPPGTVMRRSGDTWNLSPGELASPTALKINEWLANSSPGEDDWIELYNPGDLPVALRGLFLGNSNQVFEIAAHAFVAARGHVRLWASERPGPDHVDFKLPASGGPISLFAHDGEKIDEVACAPGAEGISAGRYPDGSDSLMELPFPTPRAANSLRFPVSAAVEGRRIRLAWPSAPGRRYAIESALVLPSPGWTALGQVTASGNSASADLPLDDTNRFFRIAALP